jgi:hypothetical protein
MVVKRKGLVALCHYFLYLLFLTFLHTVQVQHNQTFIHPSPFAEARLPPWGAEARIELGLALQQADALPSKPTHYHQADALPNKPTHYQQADALPTSRRTT